MYNNTKNRCKTETLSDYVVFDLETTGTSCYKDSIIEISAIKVIGDQIAEEFSALVNPGCSIPYYASQVNGITDDMVKNAPVIEDVLPEFLEFIGEFPLVGHNIHTFDMKFIYRDCERCLGKLPENNYVDTLKMSRLYLPELHHHTLTDLAEHYGISTEGAHRALNDCRMNQIVYSELCKLAEERSSMIKKCPECGEPLVKRSGKYGSFWGCSGYPGCKHTEKI